MRTYRQLTSGERYALSALRKQGCSQAQIARTLNRHPSTISREIRRNSKDRTGRVYRPTLADDYARWRDHDLDVTNASPPSTGLWS